MLLRKLRRNNRGAAALEFAIAAPILILFLIGLARLGILYMANAGLRSAVAEGARLATIYPRPSNTQISQRITASRFGLDSSRMTQPTITEGVSNGANYVDITVQYSVTMDFVFFQLAPVVLVERRRAFVAPAASS